MTEFWVGLSDSSSTSVICGGEPFDVGYNTMLRELPFTLTLLRAEQHTAAGQPAATLSWVLLDDPERGIHEEQRLITLNQPLAHRGYRCYQSGFKVLGAATPAGRSTAPSSRSMTIRACM